MNCELHEVLIVIFLCANLCFRVCFTLPDSFNNDITNSDLSSVGKLLPKSVKIAQVAYLIGYASETVGNMVKKGFEKWFVGCE